MEEIHEVETVSECHGLVGGLFGSVQSTLCILSVRVCLTRKNSNGMHRISHL